MRRALFVAMLLVASAGVCQQPVVFVNGTPQYTSPAPFSLGIQLAS